MLYVALCDKAGQVLFYFKII